MSSLFLCSSRRLFRAAPIAAASLFALALALAHRAEAQQPVSTTPQLPSYHPPVLALMQPANGGSVPQDRPVVVFRFAPGDSTDPVDARSFAVSVDANDATPLFQITNELVSGPLSSPNDSHGPPALGAHQLVARICSMRGACTEITAGVSVAASAAIAAPMPAKTSRKQTLLDLLLAAARKLLNP
ncbi:MAG: hypothetical protein ACJ796_20440 [Gemmatimonadaceae bacterium]